MTALPIFAARINIKDQASLGDIFSDFSMIFFFFSFSFFFAPIIKVFNFSILRNDFSPQQRHCGVEES